MKFEIAQLGKDGAIVSREISEADSIEEACDLAGLEAPEIQLDYHRRQCAMDANGRVMVSEIIDA